MYFFIKCAVSGLLIALISELAKRFEFFSALIASLPILSILSFIWIYNDTKDVSKISSISYEVLWLVIPSLVFFIALPLFLKFGIKFYPSLIFSSLLTTIAYFIFIYLKGFITK